MGRFILGMIIALLAGVGAYLSLGVLWKEAFETVAFNFHQHSIFVGELVGVFFFGMTSFFCLK